MCQVCVCNLYFLFCCILYLCFVWLLCSALFGIYERLKSTKGWEDEESYRVARVYVCWIRMRVLFIVFACMGHGSGVFRAVFVCVYRIYVGSWRPSCSNKQTNKKEEFPQNKKHTHKQSEQKQQMKRKEKKREKERMSTAVCTVFTRCLCRHCVV